MKTPSNRSIHSSLSLLIDYNLYVLSTKMIKFLYQYEYLEVVKKQPNYYIAVLFIALVTRVWVTHLYFIRTIFIRKLSTRSGDSILLVFIATYGIKMLSI